MKRSFTALCCVIITFLASTNAKACPGAPGSVEKIVCLADSLKSTLSASQISTLQIAYSYSSAQTWSNLPTTFVPRLGIRFADLTAAQLSIVKLLLQEVSGKTVNEGYDELNQLWLADDYLSANGGGNSYGSGLYYLCFIGTPTLTGTFEIQSGGHHLAVANTYNNGVMAGATPHFEATEPITFTVGGNTYSPISQEKNALAGMFANLSVTELATARLSQTFTDILLGAGNMGGPRDWQFPATKVGIRVGTLSAANKQLVMEAIKTYVLDVDSMHSDAILAQYQNQLDSTYIAFSGNSTLTARNDYARIDGPGVWIEFTVQGGIVIQGIHYHSIWRDHRRDYGGTGSTNGIYSTRVGSDTASILPISVESTAVYKQNTALVVYWKTSFEINSKNYVIEHSTDGVVFNEIGTVDSKNNAQGNEYRFVHTSPQSGKNYYRIKSVDVDGKTQYTKILVYDAGSKVQIKVYPNPATDFINIIGYLPGRRISVSIRTIAGATVHSSSYINNVPLWKMDISKLNPGSYIVTVEDESDTYSQLIIKH